MNVRARLPDPPGQSEGVARVALSPARRLETPLGLDRRTVRLVRWNVVVMAAAAVVLAGCGRGYEGANRSIVAELPELDAVQLLDEDHYGFCSSDTCTFGNDRSGARLTYSVDTEQYTPRSLIDAYSSMLTDWAPTVEQTCSNADPSISDEACLASFTKGDARIDLNLDNWSVGTFELHVDARANP